MFLQVRPLGLVEYEPTFRAMQAFTEARTDATADELWVCQHPPVFTLGLAGDPAHLLQRSNIPLVQVDRGGQITYHGPGQIVIYPLVNLPRLGLKVREYVALLEDAIILSLAQAGVPGAQRKPNAPGVYLPKGGALAKIAALGIKVRKGCTYHGLALNVDMDLAPFQQINPCGYAGLETIDLRSIGVKISLDEMQILLVKNCSEALARQQQAVIMGTPGTTPTTSPAGV